MNYLLLILMLLLVAPVDAGVHDDVGFTRLKQELGANLPTGKGVSVGQVEASVDAQRGLDKVRTWMPDTQSRDLPYELVDRSGAPTGVHSSHATAVARRMLGRGRDQGMASEIDVYEVFSVSHWFGQGALRANSGLAPIAGPLRIINHSWVAGSKDTRILRRTDWLTNRDEVIQVVGVKNAAGKQNAALMAASVNAIVVGRSDGEHSTSAPKIDDVYVAGRTLPHLVAPLSTSSSATPTVTSAVILLLDAARNPTLSSRAEPARNRYGETIYDAGRSEVIRAVLMAAADRETNNSGRGDIESYRKKAEYRSANGLDTRYGAGQLNVYNAWHILNAGEQEQDIGRCGFDYEPELGGFAKSGETKSYTLPAVSAESQLTTTLSWNLLFPFSSATRFDLSGELNNLDLSLYRVSDGEQRLQHIANSRVDTTETIRARLQPGERYQLVVNRVDDGSVVQDYAIAWHIVEIDSAD